MKESSEHSLTLGIRHKHIYNSIGPVLHVSYRLQISCMAVQAHATRQP